MKSTFHKICIISADIFFDKFNVKCHCKEWRETCTYYREIIHYLTSKLQLQFISYPDFRDSRIRKLTAFRTRLRSPTIHKSIHRIALVH